MTTMPTPVRRWATLLAAVLAIGVTALAARAAVPAQGSLVFTDGTANPAVADIDMGVYDTLAVQITTTAGAHTVTVYSRTCPISSAACSWVEEPALGGSFTGGTDVWQAKIELGAQAYRFSVTNAGGQTITGTYRKSGGER